MISGEYPEPEMQSRLGIRAHATRFHEGEQKRRRDEEANLHLRFVPPYRSSYRHLVASSSSWAFDGITPFLVLELVFLSPTAGVRS